jgi:ACS family glucarate transporter-like MFS transporter
VGACALWLILARERPEKHFLIKSDELALITAGMPPPDIAMSTAILRWRDILRQRSVLLLSLSYFCFGYVAYIFFTWFFSYLSTVRGLDLKSSGMYGTLPFIAMAIASPLGGYMSDRLAARFGGRRGRCIPASISMLFAGLFVALATQVADARLASVVLALGSGSLYFAQSAYWTLSADLGRQSAGSVSGVMNMGCQLGGVVVAQLTPFLAASLGWTGSFFIAAAVSFVGAFAWLFIDPNAVIDRPNQVPFE